MSTITEYDEIPAEYYIRILKTLINDNNMADEDFRQYVRTTIGIVANENKRV